MVTVTFDHHDAQNRNRADTVHAIKKQVKAQNIMKQKKRQTARGGNKAAQEAEDEEFQAYTALVVDSVQEFIELFQDACNTSFKSDIADTIHNKRIRQILKEVDIAKYLTVENAYKTFKRSSGLRGWIHGPEEGVRGLIRETITLYYAPLRKVLDEVHDITLQACHLALEESSMLQPQKNEGLKNLMKDQAMETIMEWNTITWEQLSRNLHAEVEFPAPERFRKLRANVEHLLASESKKQAERLAAHYQYMLEVSLKNLSLQQADIKVMKQETLMSHALPGAAEVALQQQNKIGEEVQQNLSESAAPEPAWTEFYMGWLEKKNRFGRWQRRWFAVSAEQQRLWYFADPEEQPARGAARLQNAIVIPELHEGGPLDFHVIFSHEHASGNTDQSAWNAMEDYRLLGIKTKVAMPCITLRASSVASKKEWLKMLTRAIAGNPLRPAAKQNDPESPTAERKISTQVFEDENEEGQGEEPVRRKPTSKKSLRSHDVGEVEDDEDKEDITEDIDEEERKKEEEALFSEILEQSSNVQPTPEEAKMLACVTEAVKEYMEDCQESITEQASKIIADGMLPLLKSDDLHERLLHVLLPQRACLS